MKSTYFKYFILSIILILLTEATKSFLQFDKLLYNSLVENLTTNQIENFFNFQEKLQWVSYTFVPIYILLKLVPLQVLYILAPSFLAKTTSLLRTSGIVLFKRSLFFLLVPIIKIIWFYFFQTNYTLEDIQYFYPLSALNITGYQELDSWLIYPLQVLNLFELGYIIYLSYQIGKLTHTNTDNGLKIVCYSYVPALFLWVTVVMFFTLNYS